MNDRNKVYILSILIILITIVVGISISYAYWSSIHITNNNILKSGCLNIEFKDKTDDIYLDRTSPGVESNEYIFTVTNTCTTIASYDVNLETLDGSNLNSNYINIKIKGNNEETTLIDENKLLSNYNLANTTLDNAIYSNNLYKGLLGGREQHKFTVISSLDLNAGIEAQEKTWLSKVIINSTSIASTDLFEVYLDTGEENSNNYISVKTGENYGYIPEPLKEGYILDYWYIDNDETKVITENTIVEKTTPHTIKAKWKEGTLLKNNAFNNINNDIKSSTKYIKYYEETPNEDILNNATIISQKGYTNAYAWLDNDTLYYYSTTPLLYFNEEDKFGSYETTLNIYSNLNEIDFSHLNTKKLTDMSGFFANIKGLNNLDLTALDTSNVRDMSYMFYGCTYTFYMDVSSFDTSNVTSMRGMFRDCQLLQALDITNFNTSKVESMEQMFANCNCLKTLDLSNFNTSSNKSIEYMFYFCSDLTALDLSNFDTSNVTDMDGAFAYCYDLASLNLTNWDTTKVTEMESMFMFCETIETIDLSSFNTPLVQNVDSLVFGCDKLTNITINCENATTLKTEIETINSINITCV